MASRATSITALLPRAAGTLLIGTQDHGWNLWNGQRFSARGAQRARSDHRSTRFSTTRRNHLWFATGNGIARCDCAISCDGGCCRTGWSSAPPTVFAAARRRSTAIRLRGAPAMGACGSPRPRAWYQVDPAHFPVNLVPPPVAIVRFAVDDRRSDLCGAPDSRSEIAAGHNHFQFDYAGLELHWLRKRSATATCSKASTTTGLKRARGAPPTTPTFRRGDYTFRVQAANNDGVWNTQGAALQFELAPALLSDRVVLPAARWHWARHLSFCCFGCACCERSANSAPCWANATASRAKFTTRWRRATSASPCSWKCSPNCCATTRPKPPRVTLTPRADLCAKDWPKRASRSGLCARRIPARTRFL